VTLDQLIDALTEVRRNADAGCGEWLVEMDIGSVDLEVRGVRHWLAPEDGQRGRVVLR
jgi:hypothetical protein